MKYLIPLLFSLNVYGFVDNTPVECIYHTVVETENSFIYEDKWLKGIRIDDGSGYLKGQYKLYVVDFSISLKELGLDKSLNWTIENYVDPLYCKIGESNG